MSKPSEIQQAYNTLIDCISDMAKDAGGLRVTDMSAIKGMTKAVINLKKELAEKEKELEITSQARTAYRVALENVETENEKLKQAWEGAATLGTEHEVKHRELLASIPKIKVGVAQDFSDWLCDRLRYDYEGPRDVDSTENFIDDMLEKYIWKLEAGK